MLHAKKYDFLHKYFDKMQRNGVPPKALTYKVLVRAFWEEGRIGEAIEAVKNMEQRGVVGSASVYYELACCLCNNGRWQDAIMQIEKLKNLALTKPLEVSFTGMILASYNGGYMDHCISLFESMKNHCNPNIGTINIMLKVYGRLDMFVKAKELFETTTINSCLKADMHTYSSMLEASASALHWEYLEYVYRKMALSGYHIDQKKYSWLLIKASRAGKWHLLEHAFDTILERGEIPHVSLFSELICQTIAHCDYGSTLNLIMGMCQASIKVTETQWIDFFQKNMDRFSKGAFQDLLNYVATSAAETEEPLSSFLRSLQSLCKMRLLKQTSFMTDGSNAEANQLLPECASNALRCNAPREANHLPSLRPLDLHVPSQMENSYTYSNEISSHAEEVIKFSLVSPVSENTKQNRLQHCSSQTSEVDKLLKMVTFNTGSHYTEVPSASEILQSWKQEREEQIFEIDERTSNAFYF